MTPISRPVLLMLATFSMLSACSGPEEVREASGGRNQLTTQERSQGWRLLFDGDDLSEWRGFRQEDVPGRWGIAQNAIHYDPEAEGDGGDLLTRETYGDFELVLDWRIARGGNSGIIYRISEDREATWQTGPEYQVLDNERHPDAANGPTRTAGAVYDLYAPSEDATKPVGKWNRARIVASDGRIEHWLNGERVAAYGWDSDDWKERVARSKFGDMPGFASNERGHIALQDHDDEVWYRNIKIRPLN